VNKPSPLLQDALILCGLWGLVLACDLIWIHLDHSIPAWDQGNHLNHALNHWRVLQSPRWLDSDWWQTLWEQAPTQRAPLVYLLTVPYFMLLGPGFDQGLGVNLGFTLLLLIAVYGAGRRLFSRQVGLWAAGLALLSPELVYLRLDYLLDYGMTAVFAAAFAALTYWWMAKRATAQWILTVLSGLTLGCCLLTRTSALLFLIPPFTWAIGRSLWCRHWQRLVQIGAMLGLSLAVIWPWFSLNWLTIINTTLQGSAYGVIYGSSPQANTLAGWLYYLRHLPAMLLWPLLLITIGLGSMQRLQQFWQGSASLGFASDTPQPKKRERKGWLAAFLVGIYILGSLGSNKLPRLLVPALPMLLMAVAQVLTWRDRPWQRWLRWGTVTLAILWVLLVLFPFPRPAFLNAVGSKWPSREQPWPHHQVVQAMVDADPWLRPNLGMVVNTAEFNPLNMDFYGALANFQVNSRQLATDIETAEADAQALNWYLTKTGDQGVYGPIAAGQAQLKTLIEADPNLPIYQQWTLPDESVLRLHRRRVYPITVKPLSQPSPMIAISAVEVPPVIAVEQASPITYRLQGPWPDLTQGALLLTWQLEATSATLPLDTNHQNQNQQKWISDHGIGLGQLYDKAKPDENGFEVVERLSVFPPAGTPLGVYRLDAQYLDRQTGETRSLPFPETTVQLVATQPPAEPPSQPGPTVDLVTLLRHLSVGLETGAIDPVFKAVGPINQYDPQQDYLVQTELLMGQRVSQEPGHLEWLYPQLLAQILQQKGPEAIETLRQITQVSPENPYGWAYLSFVYIYQWQPYPAQKALERAESLAPDLPELNYLKAAVALQQLNLVKFLRYGSRQFG
jgi:4-amino-4-deoxy-L-arabinose transferase-like glycosyltransferase